MSAKQNQSPEKKTGVQFYNTGQFIFSFEWNPSVLGKFMKPGFRKFPDLVSVHRMSPLESWATLSLEDNELMEQTIEFLSLLKSWRINKVCSDFTMDSHSV